MASTLNGHSSEVGTGFLDARSGSSARGLGPTHAENVGTFSRTQNRAILIVAVTAASISLAVAVVSLRWFLSMKRSFRHHLIFMLILSDSFKALGLFISPVVIFSCANCGHIGSSSPFSQATGFLLAIGMEAADLSILFIAMHTTLYIFRPPKRLGNGGLYRYRYCIYSLWLALPLLAASLAFTNPSGHAYVTSGTFSYLPKRPFWYRLALAWIPRYIIICSIIAMYTAIYIYVKLRFKGFDNFESDEISFDPNSMQASTFGQTFHETRIASPQDTSAGDVAKCDRFDRKPSTSLAYNDPVDVANGRRQSRVPDGTPEWEKIDFITTPPLVSPQRSSQLSLGITAADFAPETGTTPNDSPGTYSPVRANSDDTIQPARKHSTAPTFTTNFTTDTAITAVTANSSPTMLHSSPTLQHSDATDQLTITRLAIRRQLRFLFIYPLIYLLVWMLPFVQHCLNYTDYYTAHPEFWLNICSTCVLGLQAGIDCAIFSWRERPWRRMEGPPVLSVWAFRKVRKRFLGGKGEEGEVRLWIRRCGGRGRRKETRIGGKRREG